MIWCRNSLDLYEAACAKFRTLANDAYLPERIHSRVLRSAHASLAR